MTPHLSERGLILTPLGRDAQVAAAMLAEAKLRSCVCHGLPDLLKGLRSGAGFALVTEEALRDVDLHALADWIGQQPEWSDFPFILLTRRGGGIERNPAAIRLLQTLGNVTFLERPFHPTTLVSLAQAALRGRRRQYDARARLEALAHLNETLEARVVAAVAEQKIFADIVETTDAFVQVLDPAFRLIAVNRAAADEFQRLFGRRPRVGDSLLGLLEHVPERQASARRLWARALAGEEFTEISELDESGDERRCYEMRFNTLRDREGRPIGAYQFAHDVTKRIRDQERLTRIENALRQAQKMEAVGQLTGGVAHDFNNLLMAFQSGLRLLDQPMEADRRQRVADGMQQAIERGTALTRQLLAFSRRRPLEARTVDLKAQLLGMHEILQRSLRGDVEVQMTFDDALWPVEVDPSELELAVLNVCVNARDAMPAGGTISIAARNAVNTLAPVRGDAVILSISDAGVGIPKETLPRVFEPFFTTKEVGKGSGLGLAQVYAFVKQSRGHASVESELRRGTTVSLTFPRSEKSAATGATPSQRTRAGNADGVDRSSAAMGHVMLVEDDDTVAPLTIEMLNSIGYTVTHTTSASAALDALADGADVDIVFSDVMMPGGMNGVELAREIRRRLPRMPIVLTTGYIEMARGAVAEGLRVLVKPYQLEVLAETLAAHVAAGKGRENPRRRGAE